MDQKKLFAEIRRKGNKEQEKQFLFPTLYGNKAVTRNTIGEWRHMDNRIKREIKRTLRHTKKLTPTGIF